jgi:hypothetical protein
MATLRFKGRRSLADPSEEKSVALLRDVLQVAGEDMWRQMRRYTLHMSVRGLLCTRKCSSAQLKDLVVEGSTDQQRLEINGFCGVNQRAWYRPDWVALEGPNGELLKETKASQQQLRERLRTSLWDELQLAYYCGYSIWNYVAVPFVFAEPDVSTEELETGSLLSWRRLRVRFPPRVVTHSTHQTFYFDRDELLRRLDYTSEHDGTRIAQLFSGHQRFAGILIPTLCRSMPIAPDGVSLGKPSLVDIEIFDVVFE